MIDADVTENIPKALPITQASSSPKGTPKGAT